MADTCSAVSLKDITECSDTDKKFLRSNAAAVTVHKQIYHAHIDYAHTHKCEDSSLSLQNGGNTSSAS